MKNQKVKILIFTDTLCDANGVSRFLQDMSKEADQQNVDLFVVTSTLKSYCEKLDNVHILKPVYKIKMPFYKELDLVVPPYFRMKRLVEELKPDVIHVSTPGFVGICGKKIAKKYKIPLVGTYHTDFPEYIYKNTNSNILKNITKQYIKIFYKGFSSIITRSTEYTDLIHKDVGFSKQNIHFLNPGTNLDIFSPKFKESSIWDEFDLSSGCLKFLYVGRVSKEKNLDQLIEIWKEFFKRSIKKQSYLIVVGTGELLSSKESLKKYHIEFLGHKQTYELAKIYASSSIFIFPSTTDTLGQVVLEAMASGIGSIVTNVGGPKSIVNGSSKKVGFVLDIENKNSWIDLLLEIESGSLPLDKMGNDAYEYSQGFSISNTFNKFYEINSKAKLSLS